MAERSKIPPVIALDDAYNVGRNIYNPGGINYTRAMAHPLSEEVHLEPVASTYELRWPSANPKIELAATLRGERPGEFAQWPMTASYVDAGMEEIATARRHLEITLGDADQARRLTMEPILALRAQQAMALNAAVESPDTELWVRLLEGWGPLSVRGFHRNRDGRSTLVAKLVGIMPSQEESSGWPMGFPISILADKDGNERAWQGSSELLEVVVGPFEQRTIDFERAS